MDANQVNQVIDNLCSKLGMGVDSVAQLVPSFARLKIGLNGYWIVVSLIVFVVSALIFKKLIKDFYEVDYGSQEMRVGIGFVLAVIDIVFIMVFLVCSYELVGWVMAPDIRTIEYIMNMIK